jgi:DNA-directed RNA polymerase subunit M/transcription elongation factor TFIIS
MSVFDDVLPTGAEYLEYAQCISRSLSPDFTEKSRQIQRLRFYLSINHEYLVQNYRPEELVNLSTDELAAQSDVEERVRAQTESQKQYESLLQRNFLDSVLGAGTKSIRCKKCGSDKVVLTTAQTRSADEGMTGKATCSCGQRWIM